MKDVVEIIVRSGRGGDGCVGFRREKYVPRGGPDGGDGGRGGRVLFRARDRIQSLEHLRNYGVYKAGIGVRGGSGKMTGAHGEDCVIDVPPGTTVISAETGEIIGELLEHGEKLAAAEGGAGGRGNCHYATPQNRVPTESEPGGDGLELRIRLEYSVPADVAVLGIPGSGKSSFVSIVTRSRTKIGDYPFTTRNINIGAVAINSFQAMRIIDMPALIEGSSEGKGLGNHFLIHLRRVKMILLLLDAAPVDNISPLDQLAILMDELQAFDESYSEKKFIVAINRIDLADAKSVDAAIRKIKKKYPGRSVYKISAKAGTGLEELREEIVQNLVGEEE